jgi:hypothetical protein
MTSFSKRTIKQQSPKDYPFPLTGTGGAQASRSPVAQSDAGTYSNAVKPENNQEEQETQ